MPVKPEVFPHKKTDGKIAAQQFHSSTPLTHSQSLLSQNHGFLPVALDWITFFRGITKLKNASGYVIL